MRRECECCVNHSDKNACLNCPDWKRKNGKGDVGVRK